MFDLTSALLLAFPTLLSIANPIGGAFAFARMTQVLTVQQRERVARLVGLYTLIVMLVALWGGAYVLGFFGITLVALRIAGGLVIASRAWDMLRDADQPREEDTKAHPSPTDNHTDIALVPLTIPLTAGPGVMSAAVALGSQNPGHTEPGHSPLLYFCGLSLGAAAVAVVVWLIYRSANRVVRKFSPGGVRTLNRLFGFLLLCIGAQVMITGVTAMLETVLAHH